MTGDFERGQDAGRIDERLASHDRHFAKINGSMKAVAENLAALNLGIQRLIDSGSADRATVVATAKALKEADDARRAEADSRWSPWQKVCILAASLAAVAGVVYELAARH